MSNLQYLRRGGLVVLVLVATASLAIGEALIPLKAPLDISTSYYPSGWMGDGGGKDGTKCVQLNTACKDHPHSGLFCTEATYKIGKQGWAGVYYQFPDGNWGDKPGRTIVGATQVTFWARGASGGEVVEFKAGGILNTQKKYHDSFEASTGNVELSTEWKRFSIDMKGKNLSNVIGAFCWVANRDGNASGLTFYIDDIKYE